MSRFSWHKLTIVRLLKRFLGIPSVEEQYPPADGNAFPESVAAAELVATTAKPKATEESPTPDSFANNARWRYNLDALAEILKEERPEKAPESADLPAFVHADPAVVRKRIHEMNHIPILRSVSQSFQLASHNQNANVDDLALLVRRDPGLHAKILRMINSSFFQMHTEVTEVKHAMVLLGIDRIRFMAQTLGAVQEFNLISTGFDLRHLWSHSFSCGLMSEHLAQLLELPEIVHAYSAGLLHDVGKIILSSLFPVEYSSILRRSTLSGFDLSSTEREVLGCDHEEAGMIFAETQNLPSPILYAMSHHSRPHLAPLEDRDTTCLLYLANDFSKRENLGFSGNSALCSDSEVLKCLEFLSSNPLRYCRGDQDALLFLEHLRSNVALLLPRIHHEVDALLQMTFGRSAPLASLNRS